MVLAIYADVEFLSALRVKSQKEQALFECSYWLCINFYALFGTVVSKLYARHCQSLFQGV
ncbi:hypothetical protein BCT30_21805 [Enterovibrio norvegicus]|nr:hypothetical protein A1OS_02575 [Enterovibrio norvegicus]OEF58928.1 hypothetical protein A1OU_12305 [Enterovibrio norvegicus]OEF59502.1 hypothetical protein A1OW_04340 [Enterovibrio norvegicus]PMH59633.1 hypothetical protein BCU62_22310 [Enterovibrio norvegicus]PMI29372.1 hypothetical protein BCU47_19855 [Enterovibrio norvegicus]